MDELHRIRVPRVYCYMERQFVDDFFDHGRLRLSSFAKFSQHGDEQRLDSEEGHATVIYRTRERGGQTLAMKIVPAHNAYVLCGSSVPSKSLMCDFGVDSAIVIGDVRGFVKAVAAVLPGFVASIHGVCSYQFNRTILSDQGWVGLAEESAKKLGDMDQEWIQNTFGGMVPDHVRFLKDARFAHQVEYRLLWNVEEAADYTDIEVPDAIQFCESWEAQAGLIAVDRDVSGDSSDD